MNLRTMHDTVDILPEEWLIKRMKHQRNLLLEQSDWTMHTDAPTDKTAWGSYRQALRDFPLTWEPSEVADFPELPPLGEPE